MARVGLISYYRWVRVKNPYKVTTNPYGNITLTLLGELETVTWMSGPGGNFAFTVAQPQKSIRLDWTCGLIDPCYVGIWEYGRKTLQTRIEDLFTLRRAYSMFLN